METIRSEAPASRAGRTPVRRWCIPPALLRSPFETLEGAPLLDEHPPALAAVLWQAARDVSLWAEVGPAGRRGLFAADAAGRRRAALRDAAVGAGLEVSLTTLTALLEAPESAAPRVVALACLRLSRWAEASERPATAVAFAQAAALAEPRDAAAALRVGTLTRAAGEGVRAETWLRRAIGLARRAGTWEPYARAYLELGLLQAERGEAGPARRLFVKAYRAARRHAVRAVRGRALLHLSRLAADAGREGDAERLARGAVRVLGRDDPEHPAAARELASIWVGREEHRRALPLLRRVLPRPTAPEDRLATLALLARAAAGAGDREAFEEAWSGAWPLLRRLGDDARTSAALVELSRAAAAIRDWGRMEEAVRYAGPDGPEEGGEVVGEAPVSSPGAARGRRGTTPPPRPGGR